jgi:predicted RNA-binding Zn ribbon-like protein
MPVSGVTALPLLGGHLALDLINTVEPRLPVAGRHEHLAEPADLLLWAQHAGLIDAAEAVTVEGAWAAAPTAASTALTAAKEIREALSAALQAFLEPGASAESAASALEYLWLRWAAAAARSTLVPSPEPGTAARLLVGSAPALLIPDRAAHAAVDLLGTADLTRLGICPPDQHGCGWLYLDHSRNGSRRWCAMEGCGDHAKALRLTERRRTSRASGVKANDGSSVGS